MGIFASWERKTAMAAPGAKAGLTEEQRLALPPRFEAVGEALASGAGSSAACEFVGRAMGQDGSSLEEVLSALRETYRVVLGTEPSYADAQVVAIAWSESTLGYLHQLSCEDPLTGLASMAHLRSRLSELFRATTRGAAEPRDSHALVVVDAPIEYTGPRLAGFRADVLSHALRITRLGDHARTVFSGSEVIGRVGLARVVVVAERDANLGKRLALLRRLVAGIEPDGTPIRVWVEGLPDSEAGAATLLDELARI